MASHEQDTDSKKIDDDQNLREKDIQKKENSDKSVVDNTHLNLKVKSQDGNEVYI